MILTTRRDFMLGIGSLAAAGFLPRWVRAEWRSAQFNFAHKDLGNGLINIGAITSGGNVLAIPSEAGAILIDAKFAHTAPDLRADAMAHTRSDPALIINTHHHADHSGGNWIFCDSAKIIAHKNFNARIPNNLAQYAQQANNHAEQLKQSGDEAKTKAAADLAERVKSMEAEQFIAKDELADGKTTLTHGGVEIECHHFGNGHTDNDVVVFLPKHNVLHTGDLLFHECHAFIDRNAKANTRAWQDVLRKVKDIGDDKTVIIPGHGDVTGKAALQKQIDYFDRMREIVNAAIKEGKARDEVAALNPDEFKDYRLEFIRPITLRGLYDELQDNR